MLLINVVQAACFQRSSEVLNTLTPIYRNQYTLLEQTDDVSRFEAFVNDLTCSQSMLDTPFNTWLIPDWLKKLNEVAIPPAETNNGPQWLKKLRDVSPKVEIDEELQANLKFLQNPDFTMSEAFGLIPRLIKEHLSTIGKRITVTLEWAKHHKMNLYDDLSGYAMRMVKNAKIFPAIMDDFAIHFDSNAKRETEGNTMTALVGLIPRAQDNDKQIYLEGYHPKSYPDTIKRIIGPIDNGTVPFDIQQLNKAWHMARALMYGEEVFPSNPTNGLAILIENLISLRQGAISMEKGAVAILARLSSMIPIGHRMALALHSTSKCPSIVDFVKNKDGYAYGLLLTISGSLAFRAPFGQVPEIIKFLATDFDGPNSLNSVPNIRLQTIELKWYRASGNAFEMVRSYANAWPNTKGRLSLGVLYHVFMRVASKISVKVLYEDSAFWLNEISQMDPKLAALMYEKVKHLECASQLKDAAKQKEFLGVLKRRLLARSASD